MKESIIDLLTEDLAAARRALAKTTDPEKRCELRGYIRAMQAAIVVVNKAKA